MSEKNEKAMIHPWTTFLTGEMQAAVKALQAKPKDPLGALDHLFAVHCSIDEADRDTTLFNKIKREPYKIRGNESNRQMRRHMKTSMSAYWRWYDETAQLLIKKGYISGEKYKTATPTAGDKKSGKGKHEPLPEVMSSRIEEP